MTKARGGFTLIELLLALSLATVLLAALFTAMQVHVRMFHGGQHDVASAQVGRAVLRRVAEDLRSTMGSAPQPASASPTSATPSTTTSTSAPATGPTRLRGTSRWLQVEVDQTLAVPLAPVDELAETEPETAAIAGLNLVTYFVRETQATATTSTMEPVEAGLVRRELSCLYRDQLAAEERRPGQAAAPSALDADEPPTLGRMQQASPLAEEEASPEVLMSPEVQLIEFRYFDGSTWQESWDSGAAGRLPRAVAIAIALSDKVDDPTAAPTNDPRAAEPESVTTASQRRGASLFEESEDEQLPWKVYRLTVPLALGAGGETQSEAPMPSPAASPEPAAATPSAPAAGGGP